MTDSRFLSNPSPEQMPRTADVIVIGGGPTGAAALWAIERAAPGTKTVLIEKGPALASGASLASLENFRTCWNAPCLHRMMLRSIHVFKNADEFLGEGGALGIKQQGYLFLAVNERQAAGLKGDVEHLNRHGLEHIEYLDHDELRRRYPWLGERMIAAKYDPMAGWLDSNALTYRLAASARHARILLDVQGTKVRLEGGLVKGVSTANGDIDAPIVVIAAGAGSRALGRSAGIDIPIVSRPRQSFTTSYRHASYPADGPCLISAAPHPHVRPEAGEGAVFGWEYHWLTRLEGQMRKVDALQTPDHSADHYKDPRFPSLTLALLARQFGHQPGEGFADPRYLRGLWHRAGYYVYRDNAYVTLPDGTRQRYDSQRAIIDRWPDIDGLFLSVAHVGHGIMSAPAAGEILAARVLNQPLPDPTFADFGLDVPFVEYDEGGLSESGWDEALAV
ncbi:MAG: FAD-binding oxidoreductase [bacterium]|nr:FAD-binding oxidoreductase [bacterium]